MNTALLLAGGNGSRIPTDVPKQYYRVYDKMIITYAMKPLLESPYIDEVLIVAECRWRKRILADAEGAKLDTGKIAGFVAPGGNRQNSILNGLRDIVFCKNRKSSTEAIEDADTVLIHDAARPLLTIEMIEKCFAALAVHDGVMPVLPMKDTVYISQDGLSVHGLLERSHIYAGQAPELFLLGKYYQANAALSLERIMEVNGSTEPAILAGMDIAMTPGDEDNFKITTMADLKRFQEYMGKRIGRI